MPKTISIFCTLFIVCIAALGCAGQKDGSSVRKAVLSDEFRTAGGNCEEGFARLDAFFIGLNNDPAAAGTIVIYDDGSGAGAKRRLQLSNFIKLRHFDPARITFIDATLRLDAMTQFWLVPAGAEPPEILPADIAVRPGAPVPSAGNKPYLYAGEYSDGIPGCSGNLYDLTEYAAVLKADAKSRGKIVISESSQAKFRTQQREILSDLARSGIPSSRLTVIYTHVRPMRAMESTELWVVPAAGK